MSFSNARSTGTGPYVELIPVLKGAIAVNAGDLVFRDSDGYDKPASSFTWTTDLATTRKAFKKLFRGVSNVKRSTTQTTDNTVGDGVIYGSGEFEFTCSALAAAAKPGDLVTITKAAGNALLNQQVEITTDPTIAIGVISRDAGVGATSLTFRIQPDLFERALLANPKTLTFPVTLASIANGDVLTGFVMPEAGELTSFSYAGTGAKVTTASKTAALNLEIGTTDVTGGVVTITSALLANLGAVVAGTAITGTNTFAAGDLLSIEAASVTAFSEGSGVLIVGYNARG